MTILLDTHVFLWFILGDDALPQRMRVAISDARNDIHLSVASVWEITVKHQLGKLWLPDSPEVFIPAQRELHHIASLSLHESAIARLGSLPAVHNDPFDRMIICQAIELEMVIATVDPMMQRYPVSLL